jgi:hypothetical protein
LSAERIALDERFAAGDRSASLIAALDKLGESEPDAGLFRRQGICLMEARQFDDAKTAFRRALTLDHSDNISKRRLMVLEMEPPTSPKKSSSKPRKASPARKTISQDAAKAHFLRVFPLGFLDPGYLAEERNYKWAAHLQWEAELGESVFEQLLGERNFQEVSSRLRGVVSKNKLNLPSTFELMALNRLTMNSETQSILAEHIHGLVYGNDHAAALERFTVALQRVSVKGSDPFKWPIVTLFPFIAHPARHMFVKPEATKAAAARIGTEINYKTLPNALTYGRVLELAQRLMEDLADLKPRDFMDVQGFIWVAHSDAYAIRA